MKGLHQALVILLLLAPQAARLQQQEIDWSAEAARLEMHRQLWNTHNIQRYEFLLDMDCFCFQDDPAWVVVEDGKVVSVTQSHTGLYLGPFTIDSERGADVSTPSELFPTVDALFAEIERAIADHYGTTHPGPKAGSFAVEYDEQYGFPSVFTVDYSRGLDADGREWHASDSEFRYRMWGLRVKPLPVRGAWQRTQDAPLSARNRATIAWAADEIFVFGGIEFSCPGLASCVARSVPVFADGAAYDPAADAWRSIADAPVGIIGGQTVTIGDEIFVLAMTSFAERAMRLLRYRPARDSWDEFALPETIMEPGIAEFGSTLLLFTRGDQHGPTSDWQLDLASRKWTRLPDDPLGPGFSRQLVGVGTDLYLFDHALTASPGGDDGPSWLRAARLRNQQWETLPVADSIGLAPDLVAGNLLIAPTLGCADGGGTNGYGRCVPFGAVFDTASDSWRELPNAPRRGYKHVKSSGGISAGDLTLGDFSEPGHPALDATTNEWFTVPALDGDPQNTERSIAAVGGFGFAFGGAKATGELMNEAWIWRP